MPTAYIAAYEVEKPQERHANGKEIFNSCFNKSNPFLFNVFLYLFQHNL